MQSKRGHTPDDLIRCGLTTVRLQKQNIVYLLNTDQRFGRTVGRYLVNKLYFGASVLCGCLF
uniref:Uncharacterized protein n=1 Tax=Anguilla anguilla TaxID=7936 RepID=A0A0E9Q7N6_ANGAN